MGPKSITDHMNEVDPIPRVLFCKQVQFHSKRDGWGDFYTYQISRMDIPIRIALTNNLLFIIHFSLPFLSFSFFIKIAPTKRNSPYQTPNGQIGSK